MLFSNSCHICSLLANVVRGVQRASARIFVSCFHADHRSAQPQYHQWMIDCCRMLANFAAAAALVLFFLPFVVDLLWLVGRVVTQNGQASALQ
jgi:hypothetical protein